MPNKDNRALAVAKKGQYTTSGRQTVIYRDAKGRSRSALVLDAGTTSGLKLQIVTTSQIIDNVAKATTMKQTGVYFARS